MLEIKRRDLMAAMCATTALTTIPLGTAHAQTPLGIEELRELVKSQRNRSLLFMYMDFTIYTLYPYLFREHRDFKKYDDFTGLVEEGWRASRDGLYDWMISFYHGELESTLLAALDNDDAKKWIDSAVNKSENLVSNVAKVFEESGIATNGLVGSESLRGIKTVEQLNALQSGKVTTTPFLCRFFPFSYFCD